MSVRHLAKGSVVPPFTGKLRVYSMRFCPYAQRTILVLNAKKIPYEVVNINLTDKPEWLSSKSPFEKVPALEVAENVVVYESLITAEYLEDKYPSPQLVSSDPLTKAQDKLIVENFGAVTTCFFKAILQKDQIDDDLVSKFFSGLEQVQGVLVKRGTTFLGGNSPGMVDYMIWPWFERFSLVTDPRFTIDKTKFKVLVAYTEAMKQDPAVQDHYLEPAVHAKYLASRLAGNTDYDFLV